MILSACASAEPNFAPAPQTAPGFGGSDTRSFVEEEAAMEEPMMDDGGIAQNTTGEAAIERMVIKDAFLEIVVPEPADTMDEIASMAEDMGGFVVRSNLFKRTIASGEEVPHASITVRVPAERLDEALDMIKEGAGEVLNENVSGEDVTQQYTDLSSRLRNLQAAEEQLMEIMDDAVRTEDVLSVYNRLVEIREQIEVIRGQMQYFEQAAALSSINVEITAEEEIEPITIGGWQPVGTARDAVQALLNALQFIVDTMIWSAICILPVGLLIGVPLFFAVRAVIRRRRKAKAEKKLEAKE
jgi:hypothetical protein